ncbi:MAG TPA: DUF1343 domain-containing protein [Bacteroidota bacterium]|nr:DUF1343 domain-containing protein [Bacteroidota bacterium]
METNNGKETMMRVPWNMKKIFYIAFLAMLGSITRGAESKVKPGIDVLREHGFDVLKGRRVGLITNPTGMTFDMQSTVDVLFHAPGVKLVMLFSPEHGVRGNGDAGKYIESSIDEKTGLPVYSLYGKTRKPTKEMLQGIDVLVYDIQDIGVRSYTYISTMGLAMEAAAENNIPFVVLDRPDPLSGNKIEGTMLDVKFKSFIGAYPIPYVYGMTAGELAQMINGEHWLNGSGRCDLTVVKMEGWKRSMWWDETGLEWIPTSPNIPHSFTPIFYVLTGLLGELGTVNQGIGYTMPFELVGAPWADAFALARYLNNYNIPGIIFRPIFYSPTTHDSTSVKYQGVQLHITDRDSLDMTRVQFCIIDAIDRLFPDYNLFDRAKPEKIAGFDKAVGSDTIRAWFKNNLSIDELMKWTNEKRDAFLKLRDKYLLYH